MSGHPPVDHHLPRDVALVRGQENDEIGHVFGFADIWREGCPPKSGQHAISQVSTNGVGDDEAGMMALMIPCLPWDVATYMVSASTPALETP